MATNTSALKTFAQQTRIKLISLIKTKLQLVLNTDTSELRGYEEEIKKLRSKILQQGEDGVIEEVAYTWFNRMMALRFMDANGYNSPMIITPAEGQTRPEILQDAMAGTIDEELNLSDEDKLQPEPTLYRRLLVASCNLKHSSMPFLFEHITDYTELLLPDDLLSEQSVVSDIRNGMTDDDCQNVELMGWLYQFYIIDRKADAEIKKTKKGGLKSDEQAAATQLFTPHWVVRYMVENTLGKIWMTLHPESHLIDEMPYYIKYPEGQVDPIPEDISKASDIRFIDPCMGSGHVLVYAFDLFTKMYEEEGEMKKDIPNLILTNNIFGIDIDPRCYQLASFALTMKGRAYYSRYLRRTVSPNVIALQNIDHDTIESSGNWPKDSLMWQFKNVDTIGSLLKVTPAECAAINVDSGLFGANQKILKKQAEYLSGTYHCVVTNPPYLGKGFGDGLKAYVKNNFPNSKTDLYSAFIEHLSSLPTKNGYTAMVTMESWMFLSSFEALRRYLINDCFILSLSHFDWQIMRIAFGTVAFILQKRPCNENKGIYSYLSRYDVDLKIEKPYSFPKKDNGRYAITNQEKFLDIPGATIAYWISDTLIDSFVNGRTLKLDGDTRQGMATSDNGRFLRVWFEVGNNKIGFNKNNATEAQASGKKWFPYNKGGQYRKWYGNREFVLNYEDDGKEVKGKAASLYGSYSRTIKSESEYFKPCISWSKVTAGSISFRYFDPGFIFDVAGCCIFYNDESLTPYHLALLNSNASTEVFKILSPTLNYEAGHVASFPVLKENFEQICHIAKDNIAISKEDWDVHETSWDFKMNELVRFALGLTPAQIKQGIFSVNVTSVKIDSLVIEYKKYWEALFLRLHDNEVNLNKQFIGIYGLENELIPDTSFDDITILQKGEISIVDGKIEWNDDVIIKQFLSYLIGCFMGRYSVNTPGLQISDQNVSPNDIKPMEQLIDIDDDGIIPIIQEEDFFSDDMTQRIEGAIKTLFGEEYYYENIKYIDIVLGQNLRDYIFKNYYGDHQSLYSVKMNGSSAKRPIYWLFSSQMGDKKKKGYFKALVYMHRLEPDTLSKLHADYVHPYLNKINQQLLEAEDNATRDDLTQAQHNKALKVADELKEKVREVKAFEQQLVEMASHRLTIDLDDGVKANYPKYYPLVEPIKGLESSDE